MSRIDEVLRRLRAVQRERPALDKAGAEEALARHLGAVGLSRLRVHWASDPVEGRQRMLNSQPILGTNAKAWRHAESVALQGVGRLVAGSLWTDAAEAGHETSRDPARDALRDAAWSVLEARAMLLADPAGSRMIPTLRWGHPRSAALCASLAGAWRAALRKSIPVWEPFLEACEAGLWIYWVVEHEIIAVAQPVLRGLQGRLHHDSLPAVEWPSGSRWWVWRGMQVPRELIEDPGSITLEAISAMKNVEVRRVMIERYGHARWLKDLGARPVSTDAFGTLYRVELPGDEPLALVKVVNSTPEPDGSHKDYFLRVPPHLETARAAVAWTFGVKAQWYSPVIQT